MNRVNTAKVEEHDSPSSKSSDTVDEHTSTPSNSSSKKEDIGDDMISQDDFKSETGANASATGMALRERRKRTRPNARYSPESAPAPNPLPERKASSRPDKVVASGSSSNEMSHWLQCDSCHKWRIVAHRLFQELKHSDHFQCRSLHGVTCKDKDDWHSGGAGMSEDAGSMKDEPSLGYKRTALKSSFKSVRQVKRVNIFAGRYIPGFAGEFSDLDEE